MVCKMETIAQRHLKIDNDDVNVEAKGRKMQTMAKLSWPSGRQPTVSPVRELFGRLKLLLTEELLLAKNIPNCSQSAGMVPAWQRSRGKGWVMPYQLIC